MSISVVIPCYRSAATLPRLVERLLVVLQDAAVDHEVILVVDGSPDETWSVAELLAGQHPRVVAVRLSRNYGQHNALLAGVRRARFDTLVTMDDDLQHLPEELPRLVAGLSEEVELVYGVAATEEHGVLRSFASRSVKMAMSSAMRIDGADDISAFRAFHTYLRDGFAGLVGTDVNLDVALSWATTRASSVRVEMAQRAEGASNYTPRLLVRHAANMLIGYSTTPLRLVIYLGIVGSLLGFVLLVTVLVRYFSDGIEVAGFATLSSLILVFSSAQLISIGILGEYIGRIHGANSGRPTYVVRERTDADAHPDLP